MSYGYEFILGKVWNAISGEEIHSFQHKHIVKTVAFDNSSEHLVTGSNEKLIRVFNLQSANSGLLLVSS